MRRFDHVVTGLFFGHVHTDEWTLLRDCDVADPSNWTAVKHCDGKAHTLLLPGVSLTEGFPATNPALRLLEFSPETFVLQEAFTYYADLHAANAAPEKGLQWQLAYEFTKEYNMADMSPASFELLHADFARTGSELWDKYHGKSGGIYCTFFDDGRSPFPAVYPCIGWPDGRYNPNPLWPRGEVPMKDAWIAKLNATNLLKTDDASERPPLLVGSWSYAYGKPRPPAMDEEMWTSADWVTTGADGRPYPWQNLILAGDDTGESHGVHFSKNWSRYNELLQNQREIYAQVFTDVLTRTNRSVPTLWAWGGWFYAEGNATVMERSWRRFLADYSALRESYGRLPKQPFGVFLGDEQGLYNATHREWMASGLKLIKQDLPQATTYANFNYLTLACNGDNPYVCCCNPGHIAPVARHTCCRRNISHSNAETVARWLGTVPLTWVSTDEYYDVTVAEYARTYRTQLYPHLRPEQRVILLPYAAFCEFEENCKRNTTIGGVDGPADARCLPVAREHLAWARSDDRVAGLLVFFLKNLQQKDPIHTDPCQNPSGTGVGLVDRCGVGGHGGYAMPATVALYQNATAPT